MTHEDVADIWTMLANKALVDFDVPAVHQRLSNARITQYSATVGERPLYPVSSRFERWT